MFKVLLVAALVLAVCAALLAYMTRMPGESYQGPLPPLSAEARATAERLAAHVERLCGERTGRNTEDPTSLADARDYIAGQFASLGYTVRNLDYQLEGVTYSNVEAERPGTRSPDEIVIVGAHYDTVPGSPGADDNTSGVAGMLALAERLREHDAPRTLRLVAFVNEESPFFAKDAMGSMVYAKQLARRSERVVAMLSLEMLGYYRDEPGSQRYPPPLNFYYPRQGDFIAFVGDLTSRPLVMRALQLFRNRADFPSQGIAAPALFPGVSWSDHRSFWKNGFPAMMVTDTAFYRNPYYHTAFDTPDTLDYERMARVVGGLEHVVAGLLAGER